MKAIIYSSVTIIFLFIVSVLPAMGQSAERELLPLNESDFVCFQTIKCASTNEALIAKGWVFTFDETVNGGSQEVTAVMESQNISLSARYDMNGNLKTALYKRNNVALPPQLLVHLVGDQFNGFTMIANEKVVNDFDVNRTVYNVTLQNGDSIKILEFKSDDIHRIMPNSIAEN